MRGRGKRELVADRIYPAEAAVACECEAGRWSSTLLRCVGRGREEGGGGWIRKKNGRGKGKKRNRKQRSEKNKMKKKKRRRNEKDKKMVI
jgi:hypothetical protein